MKKLTILFLILTNALILLGQGIYPIGAKTGTVQAQNNLQALNWLSAGVADTPTVVSGIPLGALITRSADSLTYRFNGKTAPLTRHWDPLGATGVIAVSVNGGANMTGVVSLTIPTATSQLLNDANFITAAQAPVRTVNGLTGDVTIDGSETKLTPGANIGISGLGTILSPYVITGNISPGGTRNADSIRGSPVDTAGKAQNYVIAFDTTGIAAGGAGTWKVRSINTTYAGLTDVQITSVANGQLMTWNTSLSKWVNTTAPWISTISGIAAGGDLSGNYPNPAVAKLNGLAASYYLDYTHLTNPPAALPPNGAAGGDLGGSYPNPTVQKIKGVAVPTLAAGGLSYTGSTWVFTPYLPLTWTGTQTIAGGNNALHIVNGSLFVDNSTLHQRLGIGYNAIGFVDSTDGHGGSMLITTGTPGFYLQSGAVLGHGIHVRTDSISFFDDGATPTYILSNGTGIFSNHVFGVTESGGDSSNRFATTQWVKQQHFGAGGGTDSSVMQGLWTIVTPVASPVGRRVGVDTSATGLSGYYMRRKDSTSYTSVYRFLDSLGILDTVYLKRPLYSLSGPLGDSFAVKNDSAAWNAKSLLGVLLNGAAPVDGQSLTYDLASNTWKSKTVSGLPDSLLNRVTTFTHFANIRQANYDTLAYATTGGTNKDSIVFKALRFYNLGGIIVDTTGRNPQLLPYGFKFDTSYAPFQSWVLAHGSGIPDSLLNRLKVFTHFGNAHVPGADTLAYGSFSPDSIVFRNLKVINNGGITVDTTASTQQFLSYKLKFDTTYSPFQTYVSNHAGSGGGGITQLTGDGTTATGGGVKALTLATVNATTGAFGSASSVGTFTVNGKGLITLSGSTAILIAENQVTNLVTDLASKLSSALPSTHLFVGSSGNLAVDAGGDLIWNGTTRVACIGCSVAGNSGTLTLGGSTGAGNVGSAGVLTLSGSDVISAASTGAVRLRTNATDRLVVSNTGGFQFVSLSTNGYVKTSGSNGTIIVSTTVAGADVNGNIAGSAASITGTITESQVVSLVSDLGLKSPLASPTFTGVPAGPTASPGTSTTQFATTAFVSTAVGAVANPTLQQVLTNGSSTSVDNTINLNGHGLTFSNVSAFVINGGLRYVDGNQAAGKVMTSDVSGNASWQTPTIVTSNTFTPTSGLPGSSNVASIDFISIAKYMRIANMVLVSGDISVTPIASNTGTAFYVSLPIPSTLNGDDNMLSGTANVSLGSSPMLIGSHTNSPPAVFISFMSAGSGSPGTTAIHYIYQYQIF